MKAFEQNRYSFGLDEVSPQKELYRRALITKVSAGTLRFIEHWVDLDDAGNLAVLETSSSLNLVNFQAPDYADNKEALGCVINLKRLNDIRFVNKFIESVNEKLHTGGLFIGCVETAYQREQRLLAKYVYPFNYIYLFFDYLGKRVWPKLPFLKKYYFMLTAGRNRVISEMETYGRLYSCGFNLLDTYKEDNLLFFAAKKAACPDYNTEATYGPIIKLRRVGKKGKIIKVYKIRTMAPYSEYIQHFIYERYGLQSGGKLKNDPRITPLGRFMRKYWLDELPMLWNLLRGDLKLFGVRPLSEHYLGLYPESFRKYRIQFKPGLIPPFYVDLPKSFEEIIASEEHYLRAYERHGFFTDLKYLFIAFYNIVVKKARSN